jgi:hypothetical protein
VKRHLRWIIPLALIPVFYFGISIVAWALQGIIADQTAWAFTTSGVALVLLAAIIVSIVFTITGAVRVHRDWRHRTGRFTKQEIGEKVKADEIQQSWRAARDVVASMLAGQLPDPFPAWGIIPDPGEAFFFSVHAQYQRYYGRDVSYVQSGGFYIGRPAFVAAGLVVNAIGNASARSRANAEAAAQWREHQMAPVLISNKRMVIAAGGQWLSFYFDAVVACYPDPAHWNVAFQFQNAAPLLLVGVDAPVIGAFAVLATHGIEGLRAHPALEPLR